MDKYMQYIFTQNDTAYSCCRNIMFELAVEKSSPLHNFFFDSLREIIKKNERTYSSFYIRVNNNYGIHIEGITKDIAYEKKLNKRWMFSGSSCFREKDRLVLCLKISFRKKAAEHLLKRVFLRKKHWECLELDNVLQFSFGICGDIQNLVSFLNVPSIEEEKDDGDDAVQKIMSNIIDGEIFDDLSFENISQIEAPIIRKNNH